MNVVQNKHFVINLFDHGLSRDVGGLKKTRDFCLVKLKNYLYVRHNGVLNVSLN